MSILVICREGQAQETLPLPDVEVTLGREPDNDIVIADHLVSRRHAAIVPVADGHVVRDLGSTNGTWVNGRRIGEQPVHLQPGDYLALGQRGVMLYYCDDEGTLGDISKMRPRTWFGTLGLVDPWTQGRRWLRILLVTPWLRLVGAVIGVVVGLLALIWWIIRYLGA